MNWLSRLVGGSAAAEKLSPELKGILEKWKDAPEPDLGRPHFETRYIVLNTEASGLNLDTDRLLAIAALGVRGGLLSPADAMCCALEPDPAGGLGTLLEFIGKAPVVVFNTGFNKALIERAFEEHLGFTPEWQWLDLQWILPVLFSEKISGQVRLNNWIEAFGLETFQRHHALGDGLMIAQMLIAALGRGSALGAVTARSLIEMERSRRAARR